MKVKMDVKLKMKLGGHRDSQLRDLLVDILEKAASPLSVPEIHKLLNDKEYSCNKTTIYREIEKLVHHLIIRAIYLDADKTRYELVDNTHHHHVICRACNRVDEIPVDSDVEKFEQQIERQLKYTGIAHSLEFFGICKLCQR